MRKHCRSYFLGVILAMAAGGPGAARAEQDTAEEERSGNEEEVSDITDLSLEELLGIETTVATLRPVTSRESPGVVSVITAEEIRAAGARDLMDALMLVPGFGFGVDVQSVVGVGFRGNWGHEGKVLLLIDGQEMNEALFGTLQFGNHYPVENIKQIEVIRGPGSVIYGGYAELAVINVITRRGEDFSGVNADATYGVMLGNDFEPTTFGHRSISLGHSYYFVEQDLDYSIFAKLGQGNLSHRTYSDFWGDSYEMGDGASATMPFHLNVGLRYRELDVRLMVDRFASRQQDAADEILESAIDNNFTTYAADVRYAWKLGDGVTLTPHVNYKMQQPWQAKNDVALEQEWYYDKSVQRVKGGLTLGWDITSWINVLIGAEYFNDWAKVHGNAAQIESAVPFADGETEVTHHNVAGFLQGQIETVAGTVTAGARYEYNNAYGGAFVPRLAYTKAFERVHFKLLGSQAFRAPSIENIALAQNHEPDAIDLKAEKTTVAEGEIGFLLTKHLLVSANLFYTLIQDPILYFWDDETEAEGYHNGDLVSTYGGEGELRLRYRWGFVNFNYSYYRPHKIVDDYRVWGRDDALVGFAAHKIALLGSFKPGDHLRVSPSLVFMSERYGYVGVDEEEESISRTFEPLWLVNLTVAWEDLFVDGLTLAGSVHNLLDQRPVLLQPYDGWHSPLPGRGREISLRLSYDLPF